MDSDGDHSVVTGRDGRARVEYSATLARGARLHATRVPDDVLAAAREERNLRRLQRRIARRQRFRRVR